MWTRAATAADYDAYAALFGELGVDDPMPSRERFAAELVARTLVAEDMPSKPGAFPFRLVAPGDAAAAIALLRAYVPLVDAAFLQVGVEDDEALVAEVLRLGAHVNLALLHLRGAI